jgi:bacillopeptidase F
MKKWTFWCVCTLLIAGAAQAGTVAPRLQKTLLNRAPGEDVAVIIKFFDKLDITACRDPNPRQRRLKMIQELKQNAAQAQQQVREKLTQSSAKRVRQLWLTNLLAATVRADTVAALARYPDVESVYLDAVITLPGGASPGTPPPAGWNLTAIGAPDVWALGFTGQGTVVATLDTGVDLDHPALGPKWRGGTNSWFDPHGEHPDTPVDLHGHGTQTMGIIVAGEAGGQVIGVAPGAQWIAAKIFNDAGTAMLSDIHLSFQWILDPDGNPNTDDTPDIVNNSWGLQNTNTCDSEFQPDIDALRAAGIAVVFAAGNSPLTDQAASSISPANNPGSMAVGAVDEFLTIWEFSSRGPSACSSDIFPTVVAPGVDVMTTDLSFGGILTDPIPATGTSVSAPHLAGGMALLKSAFRNASLSALASAIVETAQDLGDSGPDNVYGAGIIGLVAAYNRLLAQFPAKDMVQIIRARYFAAPRQLLVKATSDAAPDVTLTLPEYNNVAMDYNKRTCVYEKVVRKVLVKPATVTVKSSGGGSDTKPVPYR